MVTVSPAGTDLYAALGVDASASGDEIARAFRARAKQLHPDTNADPDAAGRFGELVAAYDVLSNHRTRRAYDDARLEAAVGGAQPARAADAPAAPKWTPRRAWTTLSAGVLVTVLGFGAAFLMWHLHERDAHRRASFTPVTAQRVGDGDIVFTTAEGARVTTREPSQHGEGSDAGRTVRVRYDPAKPARVVVDASSAGRDITLGIVALKLLVGGPVFVVLGLRRLRSARSVTGAR